MPGLGGVGDRAALQGRVGALGDDHAGRGVVDGDLGQGAAAAVVAEPGAGGGLPDPAVVELRRWRRRSPRRPCCGSARSRCPRRRRASRGRGRTGRRARRGPGRSPVWRRRRRSPTPPGSRRCCRGSRTGWRPRGCPGPTPTGRCGRSGGPCSGSASAPSGPAGRRRSRGCRGCRSRTRASTASVSRVMPSPVVRCTWQSVNWPVPRADICTPVPRDLVHLAADGLQRAALAGHRQARARGVVHPAALQPRAGAAAHRDAGLAGGDHLALLEQPARAVQHADAEPGRVVDGAAAHGRPGRRRAPPGRPRSGC